MARRILVALALGAAWVIGIVLGTTGTALRTQVGREVLVAWAVQFVNGRLGGTLDVGVVGGSFLRGLEVRDVRVTHRDGSPVLSAGLVGVQYRVRDLLAGRIVLGALRLEGVAIDVVQTEPGARMNFEEVITPVPGDGGGGPRPLVAFRDVRVSGGTIVVKTPLGDTPPPGVEREDGPHGPLQVRRFEHLDALLSYLRVSSPEREAPILIRIASLRTLASDPRIDVRDLRGEARVWGDSMQLELGLVVLPDSRAQVSGTVWWPTGPLQLNLSGLAPGARTDDVRGLVTALPAGLTGAARFRVLSRTEQILEFRGEQLDVTGRAGGRMRGDLGMVLGPGDAWAFVGTDLVLDRFDLEYVRDFLDTLPFVGTVTGGVRVEGPAAELRLDLDATFTDRLVEGEPQSYTRGRGIVSLDNDDFVFRQFAVDSADIDLGTVRRLAPAVVVLGRIGGAGQLDGSWRNATFSGLVRHVDPPLPESVGRGFVRLDTRGDTVGVWTRLDLDSLRLPGFQRTFAPRDLGGVWGGTLELAGYLDSLRVSAELRGEGGAVAFDGSLFAVDSLWGTRHLLVTARGLDLAVFRDALPATALDGVVSVRGEATSTRHRFEVDLGLTRSTLERLPIDTASAHVVATDAAVTLDSLTIRGLAVELRAQGGLGTQGGGRDTLVFTASTDSVGVLDPLLHRFLGLREVDDLAERPAGLVSVVGQLIGSGDDLQIVADFDVERVHRGPLYVSRAGGAVSWESEARALRLSFDADSAAYGAIAVARAEALLQGRPDSLSWFGRSRWGYGSWIGGGEWRRDSTGSAVVLDSLGLSLATGAWFADPVAVVALRDSGVTVSDFTLRNRTGPGVVTLDGHWPFSGSAALDGSIDGLQVPDLFVLAQRSPDEVRGEINGTFHLRGTAESPQIELAGSLRDGGYGTFRTPLTQLELAYRDRRVDAQVELRRLGAPVLSVAVALPIDLALVTVERRRLPGRVSVRARADSVDLSLLEAMVPQVERIGGTFDAEFGIEGTWENPRLTGVLGLRNGSATFPALGVRHEGMNGALRLSGDTIYVDSLLVHSGSGSARVTGFVRLEELSRPVLGLRIDGREFHTIDIRNYLSLTATATLQLDGPIAQPRLTGSGTATRGVLYFADLFTKNIVNLEDTLFAEFVDTALVRSEGLGAEFQSRFLDSLRIDSLRVDMGQEFWLRSTEANVQLAGNVFVSKDRRRYRIDGTLQAPRGTYRLQIALGTSREFRVTGGVIRYLGTPDLNADLDINAQHTLRSVTGGRDTVFVNIGGTLYDPRLRLSSSFRPPLSEPEIIGYMLFGAPTLVQGTSTQGIESRMLAQWLSTTVSGQLEYALISDLGVPLDYLQIRPTTSQTGVTGAEVAFGKQFEVLGTTAFLTASPRICRYQAQSLASVGASLEFRLSQQWLIAASVDPLFSCENPTAPSAGSYQFGGDLFWEKKY
jgi:hypothetical protein